MSAPAVSAWCSAQLFFLTSGIAPLAQRPATLNQILPLLDVERSVYFCLNTWLITFAIALRDADSALQTVGLKLCVAVTDLLLRRLSSRTSRGLQPTIWTSGSSA